MANKESEPPQAKESHPTYAIETSQILGDHSKEMPPLRGVAERSRGDRCGHVGLQRHQRQQIHFSPGLHPAGSHAKRPASAGDPAPDQRRGFAGARRPPSALTTDYCLPMTQRFPCSWSQRCGVFTDTVELKCMTGDKRPIFHKDGRALGKRTKRDGISSFQSHSPSTS